MNIKQFFSLPILNLLRIAAQIKIKQINPKIIGVTGSVGKSSFLSLLDIAVKDKFKAKTTFKGNSESGLPLEILGLRDLLNSSNPLNWAKVIFSLPHCLLKSEKFDLLIAEMGVDSPIEPKNMSYLLKIIQPEIGVLLNIAPVHTKQFTKKTEEETLKAIAEEKGKLLASLPKAGTAILNIDNPYIKNLIPAIKANIITFGEGSSTNFQLLSHQISLRGTIFKFKFQDKTYSLNFPNQFLFKEYGLTILAVIACAKEIGLEIEEIIKKLENNFKLPPGRFSLIPGTHSSLIIDSSYNSSPLALKAALSFLKNFKHPGQKIIVLGDMRELGDLERVKHQEIAPLLKDFDQVILIGPLMKKYCYPELLKREFSPKRGFPKEHLYKFNTSENVGNFIKEKLLQKEDLVLVKGSQNTIFLEQVVKDLMENPEEAEKLLCRQSTYWEKVRQNFFKTTLMLL